MSSCIEYFMASFETVCLKLFALRVGSITKTVYEMADLLGGGGNITSILVKQLVAVTVLCVDLAIHKNLLFY
jgi:hypothetical protein